MMKVALIGNGYWGGKIANYIPEFFELVCVADSKTDLQREIWDTDVVGVIIATPIETHYELVKKALVHGKHVFVEKPITVDVSEATTLRNLALDNELKIGVEYTQTFSPSIKKAVNVIQEIGDLEFIEMSTKQLGRFMNFDVYWLLASHHLSILSMFTPLHGLSFTFCDSINTGVDKPVTGSNPPRTTKNDIGKKCTTGSIFFEGKSGLKLRGRIDVSLNFPGKEMAATFYGKNGTLKYNPLINPSLQLTRYNIKHKALPSELTIGRYIKYHNFNEGHNLKFSVRYFRDLIEGDAASNLDMSVQITDILCKRMQASL